MLNVRNCAMNSVCSDHVANGWLITLFETGGLLIDDEDPETFFPIAEDLESPCATFLNDGRFVVAGTGRLLAYAIVRSHPILIGRADFDGKPISVTSTHQRSECAVFTQDGTVQIFQLRS